MFTENTKTEKDDASTELTNENIGESWNQCLLVMEEKLGRPTFETCLKNSFPASAENDSITVSVTNKFAKDWIINRHYDLVKKTFQNLLGRKVNLLFEVDKNFSSETFDEKEYARASSKLFGEDSAYKSLLNPNYTFDSYVVGNSNHFASAAAMAVAEAPAKAYNPLFVYGGVGLGKTHLMHAIGHYVLSHNSRLKVLYVSTEKFTNELINSISDHQTVQFRNKYRNIDVLLIDDIQFLANKERTQEEFFHTFNDLHGANKQIVISSDRPPKEIPTLEDRLRSRFEWGLIADIQSPDLETREAILRKKAEAEKVNVPYEIISFLAEKITSNIRELEGALVRVIAFASLNKSDINITLVKEALKNIISDDKNKNLSIAVIQQVVSEYFGISLAELKGEKRDQRFSTPRQIAMFLAREMIGSSYPDIGKEFGGKDHTTVMHAWKKINELQRSPQISNGISNIKNQLTSYCGKS
ncbi:MAG: chromosomal replication initiator protein DnaA [Armatimonadota bacterium]